MEHTSQHMHMQHITNTNTTQHTTTNSGIHTQHTRHAKILDMRGVARLLSAVCGMGLLYAVCSSTLKAKYIHTSYRRPHL